MNELRTWQQSILWAFSVGELTVNEARGSLDTERRLFRLPATEPPPIDTPESPLEGEGEDGGLDDEATEL